LYDSNEYFDEQNGSPDLLGIGERYRCVANCQFDPKVQVPDRSKTKGEEEPKATKDREIKAEDVFGTNSAPVNHPAFNPGQAKMNNEKAL